MTTFLEKTKRYFLPRWRDSQVTAALGELGSLRPLAGGITPDHQQELAIKQREWVSHQNIYVASDLLTSAFIHQARPKEVLEAAQFLITSENATVESRALADAVLRGEHPATVILIPADPHASLRQRISNLRQAVNRDPHNAIAWTDLCLAYTVLGQAKQAEKCMRIAVALAPENRFVVRSAVRFLVHVRDADYALHILRSAPTITDDPWLQAAEIGVSELAETSPRFAKSARSLIAADVHSPFHISELAGALASVELSHANYRGAKKLFRKALIDPTENAVAQAAWATASGVAELEPRHFRVQRSFEARAREDARIGAWRSGVDSSWLWLYDQGFSTIPGTFGSYAASVGLQNYEEAIRIAEFALQANPSHSLLLNNLAFSLASVNRINEARDAFSKIPASERESDGVLLATEGLIRFREGQPEVGRDYYNRAIAVFRRECLPKSETLAAIFLAREECVAMTDQCRSTVARAKELAAGHSESEISNWLRTLEANLEVPAIDSRDTAARVI